MKHALRPCILVLLLAVSCFAAVDQAGRKVVKTKPVAYPDVARRMHISGTVRLDVAISSSGKVKKVGILGGHPVLANAAAEAVKEWEFEPASSDTSQTVVVKFDP